MIHCPSEKNKTSERGFKTKIIFSNKGCIRRSPSLVLCLQREKSYFSHFVCGSYALKPLSLGVRACARLAVPHSFATFSSEEQRWSDLLL